MNKRIIVILIYLFLSIFTFGQGIDNIRMANWISVDYIKQTENCLPCDCADSVNYLYYISITSQRNNNNTTEEEYIIPEVIVNTIIQPEINWYYIIFADSNKYVVSKSDKWENKVFELTLHNDTLLLIDTNDNERKFIRSSLPFGHYNDCYNCIDNIALLNKFLSLRGLPSIQTILKEKDFGVYCRALPEDKINILYSQKKSKAWVLEIDNGYLYIRKICDTKKKYLPVFGTIITKVIKVLPLDKKNKNDVPTYEKTKVFKTTEWVEIIRD